MSLGQAEPAGHRRGLVRALHVQPVLRLGVHVAKEREKPPQKQKGEDQRGLGERYGKEAREPRLHPASKESGIEGASNVGQDETSGSE